MPLRTLLSPTTTMISLLYDLQPHKRSNFRLRRKDQGAIDIIVSVSGHGRLSINDITLGSPFTVVRTKCLADFIRIVS